MCDTRQRLEGARVRLKNMCVMRTGPHKASYFTRYHMPHWYSVHISRKSLLSVTESWLLANNYSWFKKFLGGYLIITRRASRDKKDMENTTALVYNTSQTYASDGSHIIVYSQTFFSFTMGQFFYMFYIKNCNICWKALEYESLI